MRVLDRKTNPYPAYLCRMPSVEAPLPDYAPATVQRPSGRMTLHPMVIAHV